MGERLSRFSQPRWRGPVMGRTPGYGWLAVKAALAAESVIQEIKDFLDRPIIILRLVHSCLRQKGPVRMGRGIRQGA
jgi:hypothetical protein